MMLKDRIEALVALGSYLSREDDRLRAWMIRTNHHNPWFTIENQEKAVNAIAAHFLQRPKLEEWLARYEQPEVFRPRKVGLVMAGNIPLVGFHDLLCIFTAGHQAKIKLSEKDPYLLPYLLKTLEEIDPRTTSCFETADFLQGFDAVIATGSDNSARYFEAYFGRFPHIIRRNRNAVAVLTGKESEEELLGLGNDIFQYFGLGCRNVSKLYLPRGYDFKPLLEFLHDRYKELVLHEKYKHNFDYNYAVHVLNKTPFLNNGCLILTENSALPSRIACLHYEFYPDLEWMDQELETRKEEIQCVVSADELLAFPALSFGKTQEPQLWEYADGLDTLSFLYSIGTESDRQQG